MDAIVTARVPVEIKEQGNALLRAMGATPTQLVNAAYEFLLKEGKLPQAQQKPSARKRKLTTAQRQRVVDSLQAMYIGSPAADAGSFAEQLAAARDERYAHIA